MVVEMVVSDVRDDGDVELRAGRPVLVEGVARNFEGGVRRVARDHRRQPVGQRLANRASSSSTASRIDAVVIFDRAQQSRPVSRRFEDRADEPGHRRLAVGPGDGGQVAGAATDSRPGRSRVRRYALRALGTTHCGTWTFGSGRCTSRLLAPALDRFVDESRRRRHACRGWPRRASAGRTFCSARWLRSRGCPHSPTKLAAGKQRAEAHGHPQWQEPLGHAGISPPRRSRCRADRTAPCWRRGARASACGTKQPSAGST